VSVVHAFIVWLHRNEHKNTLSEHAVITRRTHVLYFLTHLYTEATYLAFSHQFFVVEHGLYLAHYLNIVFAALDFIQALLPSRGKTEKIHFAAAYTSWVCFLAAGVLALFSLQVHYPYSAVVACC